MFLISSFKRVRNENAAVFIAKTIGRGYRVLVVTSLELGCSLDVVEVFRFHLHDAERIATHALLRLTTLQHPPVDVFSGRLACNMRKVTPAH